MTDRRRKLLIWRARWRHKLRDAPLAQPVLSALVGVVVSITVAGLHDGSKLLYQIIFEWPVAGLPVDTSLTAWRLLLLPPLLGVLTGLLMVVMQRRWPGEIADPIEANALFGGKMSFWASVRLVTATIGSNAAGASVGMEAAYSQIGAAIFSAFGQRLRLKRGDLRVITAAGAAAAIAAAFNSPLAGVFYGFELVLGSYTIATLGPIGLAVAASILTLRQGVGNEEMFAVHDTVSPIAPREYLAFLAIGLIAGALGIAVMRLVTSTDRLIRRTGVPIWVRPGIGGAIVGALTVVTPLALGSGHDAVRANLSMTWPISTLAVLLAVKIVASAVSLGAGFRGGLFSTSLLMGGLLGALVGHLLDLVVPQPVDQLQAFSLVGMGAMGTAIIGAPLTMTTLAIETTGDFQAAFGVLTGVVVASLLVRHTFGYSFATWRFHLRGVSIRGAHDVGWLSELTAARMMRRDVDTVPETMTLATLRQRVPLGSAIKAFVVDDKGRYVGAVDMALAFDRELDDAAGLIIAGEMAHDRDLVLARTDNIRVALSRFDLGNTELLPVIESPIDRRVVGFLTEAQALRRYAQEMERRRSDELGEGALYLGDGIAG